jgi:hypothetical protein
MNDAISDQGPTEEELADYTRKLMDLLSPHVALIGFAKDDTASASDIIANGTMSLLIVSGKKLMVTNFHVWDYFLELQIQNKNAKAFLFGAGFSKPLDVSQATVVGLSEHCDLCVLSFNCNEIEGFGLVFHELPEWPPRRAETGDDLVLVGYPGQRRNATFATHPETGQSVSVLKHELALLQPTCEDVSDRTLFFRFRSKNPFVASFSAELYDKYDWGGMSGSLVYRYCNDAQKFFACGIQKEAGKDLDALFFASHLDLLRADGTIAA